jgi:hypothetical protein
MKEGNRTNMREFLLVVKHNLHQDELRTRMATGVIRAPAATPTEADRWFTA